MVIKATHVPINWHSGLPIYASESFLKTVSDEYGWIGGIDGSGKLLCVLPYSVIRKSIFHMIRFPVQTVLLEGEIGVEEERAFLNSASEYFRSTGADLIIPATFSTVFRAYPGGAIVAPYGSYIIDLSQPEQTLWNNLHPKHRNKVRKAMKEGVKILSRPEHLQTAYRLLRDSFRRSAKGFLGKIRVGFRMDYDTFKHQVLGLGENVKVLVAEYEGVIQGFAVIPFSGYSAYYMHGGSIPNPLTGAMNLLQWEAIRMFRDLGVRHYDFVGARINPERGSKIESIMSFKQRFGGKLVQGYMWKSPFRPLKSFLYSQVACIRSGGDFVDQERHKLERVSKCGDEDGR